MIAEPTGFGPEMKGRVTTHLCAGGTRLKDQKTALFAARFLQTKEKRYHLPSGFMKNPEPIVIRSPYSSLRFPPSLQRHDFSGQRRQ